MQQTRELLAEIRRAQPSVHVIVGTLAPFLNGSELGNNNAWAEEHNTRLRAEVAARVGGPRRAAARCREVRGFRGAWRKYTCRHGDSAFRRCWRSDPSP